MLRTFRFVVPAIAASAAAVAALALPASPALASTGNHMCESSGRYCVGGSLNHGTIMREVTPGRDMYWRGNNGSYQGHPTGTLRFNGASNTCLAGSTTPAIGEPDRARVCSGISGIIWARVNVSNGHRYINVYGSKVNKTNFCLAGQDQAGAEFAEALCNDEPLWQEDFTWK